MAKSMRTDQFTRVLVAILALGWCSLHSRGQVPIVPAAQTGSQSLERRVYECFSRQDYAAAAELIEAHLTHSPNDSDMLYNLACARCQMENNDAAAKALLQAFKAGFTDIRHMRTDPDLKGLRDDPVYRKILEEADRVSAESSKDALTRWKETHAEKDYRYATDDGHRLNFATALDETSQKEMREMLTQEADQIIKTLVDAPTAYFVLIAVPTPKDADAFFKGNDSIGGIYEHDKRRLVARDIGGSLRHEFFHLMHFGHMERLGQPHPLWIQEGLACLYEDYQVKPDGTFRFLPNDRQALVKARARGGLLIKWSELFSMSAETFMSKPQQMYPQARSVFEFISDKGLLSKWYRAYVEHFEEDRTGAKAFEIAFDQPVADTEKQWRRWVIDQPAIDLRIDDGDAALGVRSGENLSNDGVLVTSVLPGSAAAMGRIRKGDVIVSVDGQATRSLVDLRKIIAVKKVGDEVEVKARRSGNYYTVSVRLRAVSGGA